MSLKFCPKCSNILIPERISEKEFVEKCSYCNYSRKFNGKMLIMKNKIPKEKIGTKIVEEKNEFATYHNKCKKCGYDKAQIIDLGIFYSDEDNLIMLKCGKCGWSERIGKKFS